MFQLQKVVFVGNTLTGKTSIARDLRKRKHGPGEEKNCDTQRQCISHTL